MAEHARPYKIPRSVLVVIHTPDHQVLLIERAEHDPLVVARRAVAFYREALTYSRRSNRLAGS